jgi:hypothetical protein
MTPAHRRSPGPAAGLRSPRPTGRRRRAAAWAATATSRAVVARALAYAVGVGALLIAINHGDAILAGEIDGSRALRMALTVLVPYCVSTASSVGAVLGAARHADSDEVGCE